PRCWLRHAGDVGLREIVALKEQRQPTGFRESIGKTAAIIQPGRMSAFPESSPGEPSDLDLVLMVEQQIKFSSTSLAFAAFDHDRCFQKVRRRYQSWGTGLDSLRDIGCILLVQQHSHYRGSIDDH